MRLHPITPVRWHPSNGMRLHPIAPVRWHPSNGMRLHPITPDGTRRTVPGLPHPAGQPSDRPNRQHPNTKPPNPTPDNTTPPSAGLSAAACAVAFPDWAVRPSIVIPAHPTAGPYNRRPGPYNRHSGASRNLTCGERRFRWFDLLSSFRPKPESSLRGEPRFAGQTT